MANYSSGKSDALYDAIRSRKHCKQVEWEGCKKLLETNIDAGYQCLLLSLMDEAEKHKPCETDKSSRKIMVQGGKSMHSKPGEGKGKQEKEGDDDVAPSMRFHKSKGEEDGQHFLSGFSEANEFRKRVVDVLSKPYDKKEYTRLRETIRVGNYFSNHPDLEEILVRHRHERGKCITILRGFFFWLKKLTQEGSFQPWLDPECLAMEPPSAK